MRLETPCSPLLPHFLLAAPTSVSRPRLSLPLYCDIAYSAASSLPHASRHGFIHSSQHPTLSPPRPPPITRSAIPPRTSAP
ncbi:hypothetical protein CLOM_g8162 [Closterium sp. NIES-68]|nr:hypothetical protein CLOM_g8162 [Closterium sp. NIES-68]